jgi:ATP-dependent DNA helicase RecQ
MRDPRTVVTGFERDNLALDVRRATTARDQQDQVLDAVRAAEEGSAGAGIVYCRTRRAAEEYAAALEEHGRRVEVYHAGLSRKRRAAAYDAFMDDQVDIIVATSAFGMGIDKPDIRYVVHAQAPESPDTYYQEVGRAGRDGAPATATLVYRPEDLSLGRFFVGGIPRRDDVLAVLNAVSAIGGADRHAVQERTGLGPRKTGRILNLAEQVQATGGRLDAAGEPADAVLQRAEAHRKLQESRVHMMRGYAETERCRAEFLLGYFGERVSGLCGHCDNCLAGVAPEPSSDRDSAFPLHSRVAHDEFGEGTVTDLEEDRLTVLFDDVGYRTLSLRLVEDQGLLELR